MPMTRNFVGNYVSLACPDGDIELYIREDGPCSIEKRWWDSQLNAHSRKALFEGKWVTEGDNFRADFNGFSLHYIYNLKNRLAIGETTVEIPSLEPELINSGGVIDPIALFPKEQLDNFLFASIKTVNRAKKKKNWWEFWK
jgi:hypothetical protein